MQIYTKPIYFILIVLVLVPLSVGAAILNNGLIMTDSSGNTIDANGPNSLDLSLIHI